MPAVAFTLLLRLPDGADIPGAPWRSWERSAPVEAVEAGARAQSPAAAFKRYPGSQRRYFAPQVEHVLFPPSRDEAGARQVLMPEDLVLELGSADEPEHELSIDLLEIVRAPLPPLVTFGVVHLSAEGFADSDQLLACGKLLGNRFRYNLEKPLFAVRERGTRTVLSGREPMGVLAQHLFGAAHTNVLHRAHTVAFSNLDSDVAGDDEGGWRRALGRGRTLEDAKRDLEELAERDELRTERIGATEATFFALATSITMRARSSGTWLFSVRSYWSEAVLFALFQQSYLESYAERLAGLGGQPLGDEIDELFDEWMAFRNTMWWRELSYTTDIPRRIAAQVHDQLSTRLLFDELDGAFATYVDARRHRTEDAERSAIRSVQIVGAGFAVISAASAVMQVAGEDYVAHHRALVVIGLLVLGGAAMLVAVAMLGGNRLRRSVGAS